MQIFFIIILTLTTATGWYFNHQSSNQLDAFKNQNNSIKAYHLLFSHN